jgi:hypothetical protein
MWYMQRLYNEVCRITTAVQGNLETSAECSAVVKIIRVAKITD